MATKHDLRKLYRSRRRSSSGLDLLNANLTRFLASQRGTWAGYKAIDGEPSIDPTVSASRHLSWVFPRVESPQDVKFYTEPKEGEWVVSPWNIPEPKAEASKQVSRSVVDGFLVPGVAFDTSGNRLGLGKGFYDRSLKELKALKVGICYQTQISEIDLPVDAWDIPMDVIVTDAQIISIHKEGF